MRVIVGLGNPGKKYKETRHNAGFMVIDELLNRNGWDLDKTKFQGQFTMEMLEGNKVILLKPQTYMNLSGESIRPLMDFYEVAAEDLIVIYDDLDLPAGKIRLRHRGGHGGHNGMRSTIEHLGTKDFNRIRVGIGRPEGPIPVIDYVLGKFTGEEQVKVNESIERAAAACEEWIKGKTFAETMNHYNQS